MMTVDAAIKSLPSLVSLYQQSMDLYQVGNEYTDRWINDWVADGHKTTLYCMCSGAVQFMAN